MKKETFKGRLACQTLETINERGQPLRTKSYAEANEKTPDWVAVQIILSGEAWMGGAGTLHLQYNVQRKPNSKKLQVPIIIPKKIFHNMHGRSHNPVSQNSRTQPIIPPEITSPTSGEESNVIFCYITNSQHPPPSGRIRGTRHGLTRMQTPAIFLMHKSRPE